MSAHGTYDKPTQTSLITVTGHAVPLSSSDLIALISDRRIDTSGAFYGVGAPEVADNIFHAVASEYINEHCNGTPEDRPSAIRFNSQWAIEKDGRCQLDILRDPMPPNMFLVISLISSQLFGGDGAGWMVRVGGQTSDWNRACRMLS